MSTEPRMLIDRYVEWLSRGRLTGRIAYATRTWDVPPPQPGAEWRQDKHFAAKAELRRRPALEAIFTAAIKDGAATVQEAAAERGPASAEGRRPSPDCERGVEPSGSAVRGRAPEPEVDRRLHL